MPGPQSEQSFLDDNQYTRRGIKIYERIFGDTFVSTGGQETTQEMCRRLDLQPGEKVLDVGSGIGGSAIYMAREFGVDVHGIDLSTNMMTLAMENREKLDPSVKSKVLFEMCDVTRREFDPASFDLIYSRDAVMHIANKEQLFQKFHAWLRPGGRLLVTDYCCGDQKLSEEFRQYTSQRGYHLITVSGYQRLLQQTGFQAVVAEDSSRYFQQLLRQELQRFDDQKEHFLQEFTHKDLNKIRDGWVQKISRCSAGDQVWGIFQARKM